MAIPEEVSRYLAAVGGERGESLRAVFEAVHGAMPEGYELESFRGAPSWVVPLSTFSPTYNGDPLSYVALMAQKNYNSLYLMGLYRDGDAVREFREAWLATGLKLDMGKSCLRFRTLEDVDLGLLRDAIASFPVERLLESERRTRPGAR